MDRYESYMELTEHDKKEMSRVLVALVDHRISREEVDEAEIIIKKLVKLANWTDPVILRQIVFLGSCLKGAKTRTAELGDFLETIRDRADTDEFIFKCAILNYKNADYA